MRAFRLILCLVFVLAGLTAPGHADEYLVTGVGVYHFFPVGITDDGTVVIISQGCDQSMYSCFTVVPHGEDAYRTTTDTQFSFDNGSICLGGAGRCNEDYSAVKTSPYDGTLQLHTPLGTQVFATTYAFQGPITDVFDLNALGDFVFATDSGESYYFAYDLTSHQAPEPSTIVLLGSGLVGIAGGVRRRYTQR